MQKQEKALNGIFTIQIAITASFIGVKVNAEFLINLCIDLMLQEVLKEIRKN